MKFERFVAMRYMLKRKGLFAVITTLIGVAGVSVGVAALITTLSVMNGFQSDIKEKIIGAQSHILVFGRMAKDVYPQKMQAVEALPDVEGAAPNIYGQAIISYRGQSLGVIIRGLDPKQEAKINNLNESLTEGSFDAPAEWGEDAPPPLVLGTELAMNLNLFVGDDVVLISPQSISTGAGMFPKMKRFRISGLLRTGYYEFQTIFFFFFGRNPAVWLRLRFGHGRWYSVLTGTDRSRTDAGSAVFSGIDFRGDDF